MDETMSFCQRCEAVPQKIDRALIYRFWPPHGHTRGKFQALLKAHAVDWAEDAGGCIAATIGRDEVLALTADAPRTLSAEEVKAIRVLTVEEEVSPGLREYPLVMSFHQLSTMLRSDWLIDLLARKEMDCRFHPIAYADDPSAIFGHAATVYGRDDSGGLADPDTILPLARDADMLFQADRAMRLAAIYGAAAQRISTPLFVSFSPAAIYDPNACLRTTVQATRETGFKPEQIVFCIDAPDHLPDFNHLQNILSYYRGSGFRVALGRLGAGFVSFDLFQKLRPDFLVFDRSLVSGIAGDPYKDVICRKILEIAQRLQIETVVPGVTNADELQWLYEHGANYVQGPYVEALAVGAELHQVA